MWALNALYLGLAYSYYNLLYGLKKVLKWEEEKEEQKDTYI